MPSMKLAKKEDVDKKGDAIYYDTPSKAVVMTSNGEEISRAEIPDRVVYGFHVDASEGNPETAVTYLADAVGMTPLRVNLANGVCNYGSWKDAFFMPKPCMLKFDGTVDYYLNPNDYSKREDGSSSDVANSGYDGNAMMEWGQNGKLIWYRIAPDAPNSESFSVMISDTQIDETYHSWNFINDDGKYVDHFYTPIYEGSLIGGKLRSISGQTVLVSCTGEEEIIYAQANGPRWYTETYADILLLQILTVLVTKSLNSQAAIGNGNCNSSGKIATGTANGKGMFTGSSATDQAVKCFGMENLWGNVWMRIAGLIQDKGYWKFKLTWGTQDGSTVVGYNGTGAGYRAPGWTTPAGTPDANGYYGGYVKGMYCTDVLLPRTIGGSDSTYFSDYYWGSNKDLTYVFFGGRWLEDSRYGIFALDINEVFNHIGIRVGSFISYRPAAKS